MKSNNIFNYVIYALLGVLFLSVAYYALEKRKDQALKEEEMRRDREQLEKSLADMGSVGDTTSTDQSTYVGENAKTTANKDGIEDEPSSAKTTPTTAAKTTPAKTTPAPTTTKPATTASAPKTPAADPKTLVAKAGTTSAAASRQSVAPANNGRYHVVVGAFGQVANAREEMEKFVKMGYQDAEVVKHKDLWRVIAKRCTSRKDAEKYENDIERRGIDAMIVDAYKK
jgi:cell division protein FtsN